MQPLDYLVIAPHPDDAELGAGGTIALLQAQGARVGVLDLTDGEPTPFGSPEIRRRETDAATGVLGLAWRGNLELDEPSSGSRPRRTGQIGWRLAGTAAARPLRPLLGRRPSRSPRRHGPRGRRPLLGQADQDRPPRRSVLSATHPLLLQRPPAHPSSSVVRVGRDAAFRDEDAGRRVLSVAVHRGPRSDAADRAGRLAGADATGAGPSAPATANRSCAARKWDCASLRDLA